MIEALRTTGMWAGVYSMLLGVVACNLVGSADLPPGTTDPANYRTPQGALSMYYGGLTAFQTGHAAYLQATGLLTDELSSVNPSPADERQYSRYPKISDAVYPALQRIRGATAQAVGALAKYRADELSTPALRGEMYALQAYAELQLADLYCSGIPLSTLDFEQDYTYRPPSTTKEVYRHAMALFDTALTLSADSARLKNLALVGKARALVALDSLAKAAATVAAVPTDFQYAFLKGEDPNGSDWQFTSVSDREGTTGLPYRSSSDPRTAVVDGAVYADPARTVQLYFPGKYAPGNTPTPHVVASGIEARLIEAEAQLAAHNTAEWLATLNTLRTTGAYTSIDTVVASIDESVFPPDTTFRPDTAWVAGIGGVGHLGLLQDPGTDSARVTLLFNERAKWLFLTGHRQGDLRRLVRNYHRRQQDVYPSLGLPLGQFPNGDAVFVPQPYGSDITAPVQQKDEGANPYYHGCINRDA